MDVHANVNLSTCVCSTVNVRTSSSTATNTNTVCVESREGLLAHTHQTHTYTRKVTRTTATIELRSRWTSRLVPVASRRSSSFPHYVQTPSANLSVSRPVNKPDWSDRVKRCHVAHPRSERSTTLRDVRVGRLGPDRRTDDDSVCPEPPYQRATLSSSTLTSHLVLELCRCIIVSLPRAENAVHVWSGVCG